MSRNCEHRQHKQLKVVLEAEQTTDKIKNNSAGIGGRQEEV